jgi:hypothetical protein
MAGEQNDANPTANQMARLIAFVAMVGAGLSAFLSFAGKTSLGMKVCLGSAGVGVLILLGGAWLVAASNSTANRPEE